MGLLDDARAVLEVDTLLLGIPDRSFPSAPDADTGAGAPDAPAGRRFLERVRVLGFTGVQLAPQGDTSADDPSPYDGTLFARGRIALAVGRLADPDWGGLLGADEVARLVAGRPPGDPQRVAYRYAHAAHGRALAVAHAAFVRRHAACDVHVADVAARLDAFTRAARPWLERAALYEVLADAAGGTSWTAWPDPLPRRLWAPPPGSEARHAERRRALLAEHADAVARWAFGQMVLHAQHAAVRAHARRLGLALWGDLQVGFSPQDEWSHLALFLPGYRLGAPPSRTNPEGQPWNYPVFDPSRAEAVDRFFAMRLDKTFAEYDGVRIDHPHGLVCPWVYRAGTGDDRRAVRGGARLFATPDAPDHPALARFAIVRPDQLNPDPRTPRHADDWVIALTPEQETRYGRLFDVALAAARRHGRDARALACEVLSTCPYPLRRVLERHGLGRFRVTQKADLDDPADGYRSENAEPPDWMMVGTHDTAPIWAVVRDWDRAGTLRRRAEYLASRLAPDAPARAPLAARLAAAPALLVHAQFADLFASRARNVQVFFTDAFGLDARYNRPGEIHEDNWTLRLAADWEARYRERLATDGALNLPLALAMALRARGAERDARAPLVRRLDAEAEAWRRGELPA